jgi:hypothetical protein
LVDLGMLYQVFFLQLKESSQSSVLGPQRHFEIS